MRLEVVTFHIDGISPLLQNNPAAFIGKKEDGTITSKPVYDDEQEAELRLYKLPDGSGYYHPAESFVKAAVAAVAGKKFGKQFATKMLKSALFVSEPYCIILDDKGKLAKKYGIDRRGVVIGKARVLRCRPCWFPWSMTIALELDTALVAPAQLREALSLAGRYPGIGDFRPEKAGGFGRFRVQ